MSSILFSRVENTLAVLLDNGVYKQVDVYESEKYLFAKARGGYIRLQEFNRTSVPRITWKGIEGCEFHVGGSFGWLKLGKKQS